MAPQLKHRQDSGTGPLLQFLVGSNNACFENGKLEMLVVAVHCLVNTVLYIRKGMVDTMK